MTLHALFLAALHTTLSAITGASSFATGAFAANRPRSELTARVRRGGGMSPEEALQARLARLSPAQRELLRRRRQGDVAETPAAQRAPLSAAQRRLWFLHRLDPGPAYNCPLPIPVRGPVDDDRLAEAVRRVSSRHEALRTRFVEVDGSPFQVADLPPAHLERHAIAGGPRARAVREEARRPFDLERGPLFRASLWRTDPDDARGPEPTDWST